MNKATISFDASIKKFVAKFGDVVIAKGNFREYVAAVIELNLSKKAKKLAVTAVEHIDTDKDPVLTVKRVKITAKKNVFLLKSKVLLLTYSPAKFFNVIRKKDNVVIAENVTKEVAESFISKAKIAKKAALMMA